MVANGHPSACKMDHSGRCAVGNGTALFRDEGISGSSSTFQGAIGPSLMGDICDLPSKPLLEGPWHIGRGSALCRHLPAHKKCRTASSTLLKAGWRTATSARGLTFATGLELVYCEIIQTHNTQWLKARTSPEMRRVLTLEQLGDDTKGFDLAPGEAEHLAGLRTVELGLSASDVVTTIDKAEEARILRKIDWRLVPC